MPHTSTPLPSSRAGRLVLIAGLGLLFSSFRTFAQQLSPLPADTSQIRSSQPSLQRPDSLPPMSTDWLESQLSEQLQLGLLTTEEAEQLRASYAELRLSPLDINHATEEELQQLPLLSSYAIYQLLRYRADHGGFHEVAELKLVPGWSPKLLQQLRPLLSCSTERRPLSWQEANLRSRSTWQLLYGRQTRRPAWQGSPDLARLQLLHELPEHLRLFLAGEKDAGERWRQQKRLGFDSYHLSAELRLGRGRLLLGDYRLLHGCGLVLGQGVFPLTFQSLTPRLPEGIRPLRHSTETGFSRGIAGELRGKGWELGAFYARQAVDARRSADGQLWGVTTTGLHRTALEIARRGQGHTQLYGALLTLLPHTSLRLSLQLVHQDWRGDRLHTPPGSHQRASIQGLAGYTAGSIAYRWQSRSGRLRLQGELARTDRRAWAFVQHLSLLQQSWGDLHLHYWHVGRDYWTDYGRAGTHGLQPNDEQGARVQYQFTPAKLLGTTLLFAEGYRSLSEETSGQALRSGWAWGGRTSLPLSEQQELTFAYHRRRSATRGAVQRFRLQYGAELAGWATRLTLLYSQPTDTRGWALLGATTGELARALELRALAGYFDAPVWEGRLYSQLPQLAGEYRSLLLYGRGAVFGMRLQYSPSAHWRVGLRLSHITQRTARPSETAGALEISYRDF